MALRGALHLYVDAKTEYQVLEECTVGWFPSMKELAKRMEMALIPV